MTEAEANELIHQRFEAGHGDSPGWFALHPNDPTHAAYVPVSYRAEVKFTTQDVGELGAWARFSINPTTLEQTTQGGEGARKFEYRGHLFVQLFAAITHIRSDDTVIDGDATLQLLVEDVRKVLMAKNFDGFHTFEARRQPLKDDGAWNACVVVIPFLFEETR